MRIKQNIANVGLALAVLLAVSARAQQHPTLTEFDNGSQEQRSAYVSGIIVDIYRFYKSKPETAYKATCIEDIYYTANASGTQKLLTIISSELNVARQHELDVPVKDIIYAAIERACTHPTQE